MVTNTKTNVKLNGNLIKTDDSFTLLDYVQYLEPSPNKNGKFLCPNCNKNDFDFNRKTGKQFQCFSGDNSVCHANNSYNIIKALKLKANTWVEKNNNYSFTSVSNTNVNKPAVTVDSVKVHKKVKIIRPVNKTLRFYHEVINSTFKVCLNAVYKDHEKKYCYQTAIDDTGKEIDFDKSGIDSKDVLPYCKQGFDNLVNENPEKIAIVESQSAAKDCSTWLDTISLPVIAVYGGANKNLIPSLIEHLKLFPKKPELIVIPDMDSKGYDYMMTLADQAIDAGFSVGLLKPYPDSPCWDILDNLPKGHEAVGPNDYLFESNLPAEEIIKRVTVLTKDELERMLTGETVTVSNANTTSTGNINLDSWTENVKEIILQSQASDNYLVEGLFSLGRSILIGAKAGLGKSTMMTQLSISIALGLPFMGRKVKQGKVIYCTSDEDFTTTTDRLVTQGILQNEDDFYNNFILIGRNKDTGKNWSINYLEVLKEFFKVHQPAVFVLDSLTTAISAPSGIDVNKPEIADAIENIIDICREHGVTFLLLHHLRKDSDNDDNCYAGNHQIPARFDATWKLERVTGNDNARVFKSTKDRDRQCTKYDLDFNPDTRSFSIDDSTEDDPLTAIIASEVDENITDKDKLILDCLAKGQKSVKELSQSTGINQKTLYRRLSKLIDSQSILKVVSENENEKGVRIAKYYINQGFLNDSQSDSQFSQGISENENENENCITDNNLTLTDVQSENVVNVQNEVIENFPTSEKVDTLDTEKESKPESKTVNGITFKTGDIYWQFKNKDTLIEIAYFPDGCDYAKCYKVVIDSTGKVSRDSKDPGFILWLNKEVYPYKGHQTSLL